MAPPIQQTVTFTVPPQLVYEALMDSQQHAAFTGGPAKISREVGGEFSTFDGYITGKNIELVPDKRIVQSWRAVDWDADVFSTVTFELTPVPEGTRLDFTHTDLPDGTEPEFTQGWIDNYWEPMKRYFSK
jgi:activator of HSP90 ATPase